MTHSPLALTAHGIGDMLAAVPVLLGFQPDNDLCLLGLEPGTVPGSDMVVFTARRDLPEPGGLPVLWAGTRAMLERDTPDAVVLVGYGPAPAVTAAIDVCRRAAADAGVWVRDAVRVTDGRYWSYLCTDPECCPVEGTAFDTVTSTVTTAATVHGVVVAASRQQLADVITAVTGETAERMRGATEKADRWRDTYLRDHPPTQVARLWEMGVEVTRIGAATYRDGGSFGDGDAALLSVLLSDLRCRDLIVEAVITHAEGLDGQVALWADLTRRAQANVAACATLLALAAWTAGQGELANIAARRALDADPDYELGRLIAQCIRSGLPPLTPDDVRDLASGRG